MSQKAITVGKVFLFGIILLASSAWVAEAEENDSDTDFLTKTSGEIIDKPNTSPTIPCEKDDYLAGKWTVRIRCMDKSGENCWTRCKLQIGDRGIIEKGLCLGCDGQKSHKITGGQLALSLGCVVMGKIETSKKVFYVTTGAIDGSNTLVLGLAADQQDPDMQNSIESLLEYPKTLNSREDIAGVLLRSRDLNTTPEAD